MGKFKFVYVPVDNHEEIKELEHDFDGADDELEGFLKRLQDHFRKSSTKTDAQKSNQKKDLLGKLPKGTKVDDDMLAAAADMQLVETVPLLSNTKDAGYVAVQLYCDDSGVLKNLPTNARATQMAHMIGNMVDVRGDAFIARIFDNEDEFRRMDFALSELSSTAPWVQQAQAQWRKKMSGPSVQDTFERVTKNAATASKVKELSPAEALKEEGNKAFKQGKYEEAVRLYRESYDKDTSLLVSLSNRAQALLKLNRPKEAAEDCSTVLQADPKNLKALLRRGTALLQVGDKAAAGRDFMQASLLDPGSQEAKDGIQKCQA